MNAIEFNVKTTNGIIKIPEKYLDFAKGLVHIIILKDEEEKKNLIRKNKIGKLLKQIQKQNIFDEIEDPQKWQKEIRNEWT